MNETKRRYNIETRVKKDDEKERRRQRRVKADKAAAARAEAEVVARLVGDALQKHRSVLVAAAPPREGEVGPSRPEEGERAIGFRREGVAAVVVEL